MAIKVIEEAAEYGTFNTFSARAWADLLVHADAIIETDRAAGETTCVVVVIGDDGRVVGASCGDSGGLVVGTDGTIDDLTAHQKRKLRLGSGRAMPITFERPAMNGTLVVASDGLLAYARPDVIAQVAKEYRTVRGDDGSSAPGRADLWCKIGDAEYTVEAKQNPSSRTPRSTRP